VDHLLSSLIAARVELSGRQALILQLGALSSAPTRLFEREAVAVLTALHAFAGASPRTVATHLPLIAPLLKGGPLLMARPAALALVRAPVIDAEARELGVSLEAHYAHLLVHGTLHAQGYDHERDEDAVVMEARETEVLRALGYADPYGG
jgi:hypothetical protein